MLSSALLFAVLVASAPAESTTYTPVAQNEAEVIAQMTEAAKALLPALPQDELKAASFAFAGPEHRFWHWIPAPLLADHVLGKDYAPYGRFGVPVEKMSVEAIALLHRLLHAGLSAEGCRKVDQALHREGGDEPQTGFMGIGRAPTTKPPGGPGYYFFSLFGTVGDKSWAWRFEGHHISLTFEIVDGHVHFSPEMFGHNPSPVPPEASIYTVQLYRSLSQEQQSQALIIADSKDPKIPQDMNRSPARPALAGAALGQLSPEGQFAYAKIIEDLIGNFPEPLVKDLRAKLIGQAAEAHLAWYGGFDDASPHYLSLQGPSFLIQVRHQGLERGHAHVHTSYRSLDDGSVASMAP